MRGLRDPIWSRGIDVGEALAFERCRSVHTIGMKRAITVAALDQRWEVVAVRRLRPWRILLPRIRVRHVLECAEDADLRPGDRLIALGRYTRSAVPQGRLR
jgi:hypothetical protein